MHQLDRFGHFLLFNLDDGGVYLARPLLRRPCVEVVREGAHGVGHPVGGGQHRVEHLENSADEVGDLHLWHPVLHEDGRPCLEGRPVDEVIYKIGCEGEPLRLLYLELDDIALLQEHGLVSYSRGACDKVRSVRCDCSVLDCPEVKGSPRGDVAEVELEGVVPNGCRCELARQVVESYVVVGVLGEAREVVVRCPR